MKFLKVLNNKKLFFILIGILVILHLMAFAYRAHIGPAETIDSKAYFLCAQNASEGLGFQGNAPNEPYTEEDVTIRPIGYPAIILLLGKSKIAIMGIQILFSLSTIIVCLIFLRKKGFSILSQNILLFGFLFTPSQILYATTLMTEIPFQFFLTVSFLSIALFIEQKKFKWIFIATVGLCFGILIKPILFPFTILFFIIGCIYLIRLRLPQYIPLVTIPLLVVIAYSSWNLYRTGAFEISSIQTTNLLNVNMKHILYQAEGKERGDQIIDSLDKESYQIKNYAARQKFRSKKAQEIALNYPIITTFQHCKGIILFFLDPGRFDWANYTGINKKLGLMNAIAESNKNAIVSVLKAIPPWLFIILTFVFAFNILKIFLFSRFILKEKNFTALKITLCSEIFYISFITGSLGVSRYALPIVPALLIGVAIGASSYKHGEN